jgi:hypothetical protein
MALLDYLSISVGRNSLLRRNYHDISEQVTRKLGPLCGGWTYQDNLPPHRRNPVLNSSTISSTKMKAHIKSDSMAIETMEVCSMATTR